MRRSQQRREEGKKGKGEKGEGGDDEVVEKRARRILYMIMCVSV